MKTIESTLAMLTGISIVEDLRKVLREKDREFLPVEAKFQEAVLDLATRIGNQATQELVAAWDRQICSDLVYAGEPEMIDSVICNGRFLMKKRIIPGEAEIIAQTAELCKKLKKMV